MLDTAVRKCLDDRRDEYLAALFELLAIPSVANVDTPDSPCRQAAEWIAGWLDAAGLTAQIAETAGKPAVIASRDADGDRPTLLIYGHYDVQPSEPLDLWDSAPFAPEVRDRAIYARGANDDKGQLFAHLMAMDAWNRAGNGPPVNLRVLIEGEEEVGSPNLEPVLAERREQLAADAAVISDSEFFTERLPAITYALRGLVSAELSVTGPAVDLHSGLHGGAVANPIAALARMIAAMHDDSGRVTIPGFYDDVLPLGDDERREWNALPFDEREYAASLGVEELAGGEAGFSVTERRWARPTLDCNGIVGGHTGVGSKTIIPSSASAKLTMRLVAEQDPHRVVAGLREFVAGNTPPGVRAAIRVAAEARPVMFDRNAPIMQVAADALDEAFGARPAFIRCGASVPATEQIQRLLGLDAAMMGFGLPDDNLHSPNEHFRLTQLFGGAVASAVLMQSLAGR